jgi:hypothetical protein
VDFDVVKILDLVNVVSAAFRCFPSFTALSLILFSTREYLFDVIALKTCSLVHWEILYENYSFFSFMSEVMVEITTYNASSRYMNHLSSRSKVNYVRL